MRRMLFISLLPLVMVGCSLHLFPSRVLQANRVVVSFLIGYARALVINFSRTGQYEASMTPQAGLERWPALARRYSQVRDHEYACRFEVQSERFNVSCAPLPSSGLRIAFYIDESRSIRTAENSAGPSSPRLRLDEAEERELFFDRTEPVEKAR